MTRSSARQAARKRGAGFGRWSSGQGPRPPPGCSRRPDCRSHRFRPPCCRTDRRTPSPGLLVPPIGDRDDVEVKGAQPLLVQREVHRAKFQLDAQFFQVARPGRDHAGAALRCCPGTPAPWLVPGRCATCHPARSSPPRAAAPGARRRLARSELSPSVRGGWLIGPNTAAGNCARHGSSKASSSGEGAPCAEQSVLPNSPCTRW